MEFTAQTVCQRYVCKSGTVPIQIIHLYGTVHLYLHIFYSHINNEIANKIHFIKKGYYLLITIISKYYLGLFQ